MNTIADTFKARIAHEIRERPELTRNALAAAAGIHRSTLSNKIAGQVPFTLTEVEALAKALKLDFMDMLTDHPES